MRFIRWLACAVEYLTLVQCAHASYLNHGFDILDAGVSERRACGAINQALVDSNRLGRKYIVYRCWSQDVCGGWGDRVAGLLGAAFLAIATRRSLKIDAVALHSVFGENLIAWRYDPVGLGISQGDQKILTRGAYNQQREVPFPDPTFAGLSPDVAVLNSLNSIRFRSDAIQEQIRRYRVVFFVGNRGFSEGWYKRWALGWHGNKSHLHSFTSWSRTFRCIWDGLFRLQNAFLERRVEMLDGTSRSIGDLLSSLSRRDAYVAALQLRVKIDSSSSRTVATAALPEYWQFFESCIRNVVGPKAMGKRIVLIVISNHHVAGRSSHVYFKNKSILSELWTHKLSGDIHLDRTYAMHPDDTDKVVHTFKDTMVDWLLMTRADALFFDHTSGFPVSAGLMAARSQRHHFVYTCDRIPHTQLLSGRFS